MEKFQWQRAWRFFWRISLKYRGIKEWCNMERKEGYKTKNRQLILDYLRANKNRTVRAADIAKYMETQGCAVNKTTIYRYLDKLEADALVLKYVADKGESAGYQFVDKNAKCQEHLHLQCASCGKIIHLDCGFMDEFSEHIRKHHGFVIECKNSILYGTCEECGKKKC